MSQNHPVEPADIRVFVSAAGTDRILCRLERLTILGAQIILEEDDHAAFPVGGDVDLRFSEAESGAKLVVPSRVAARKTEKGNQIYDLEFLDPQRIRALLRPVLAKLFSKRQAFRATPRPLQPIRVTIEPPQAAYVSTIRAPMLDVSTTGLAVLVPMDFEEEMATYDVVRVRFTLPMTTVSIEMAGIIRNRHLEDEGVSYGIEFYRKGTEKFERKLARIIDFVIARQHEQLDEWDDPTNPGVRH